MAEDRVGEEVEEKETGQQKSSAFHVSCSMRGPGSASCPDKHQSCFCPCSQVNSLVDTI